jgi:hypothetical protein
MNKKVLDLIVSAKKLVDKNFDEKSYVENIEVKDVEDVETKANEVMNTGATAFGTELIPTNVMLDPMLDLVPTYSRLLPLLP